MPRSRNTNSMMANPTPAIPTELKAPIALMAPVVPEAPVAPMALVKSMKLKCMNV